MINNSYARTNKSGRQSKANTVMKLNFRAIETLAILILSLGYIQLAVLEYSTVSVVVKLCFVLVVATILVLNQQFFKSVRFEHKRVLIAFGIYGVTVFIHSIFVSKSYEQWSYLVNVFVPILLLPYFCIFAANAISLSKILKAILYVTIPSAIVYLIIGPSEKLTNLFFINYISVIYLLLILVPFLRRRWQVTVVIATIASINFDWDNRSNLLSIAGSLILLAMYYLVGNKLSKIRQIIFLGVTRKVLLFGPLILLMLGALGLFNVFKYVDDQGGAKAVVIATESGRLLSTDSRTGIYQDAIDNLQENNAWVFGTGATAMYRTHLAFSNSDYDAGRLGGSESGFLALLMFGGVIYVALLFALCFYSSYLAVYCSNNVLIKFVGLFVAFRWFFLFIESPLSLNFTWITFFVSIGMAFNPILRSASDSQINYFLKRL